MVNETHHFGTDTILLADFCLPVKGKQAAELGAGCGAISMIWLREQPPAHITAVEIQEEAVDLLRRTVKYNEKEELVTVLREDQMCIRDRIKAVTATMPAALQRNLNIATTSFRIIFCLFGFAFKPLAPAF